jgi:hypothetical protein
MTTKPDPDKIKGPGDMTMGELHEELRLFDLGPRFCIDYLLLAFSDLVTSSELISSRREAPAPSAAILLA